MMSCNGRDRSRRNRASGRTLICAGGDSPSTDVDAPIHVAFNSGMQAQQSHLPVAELACRCGHVCGRLLDASPRTVNRVLCYCDDCQAFAHEIGRNDVLDARGGTDIVQVAPWMLRLDHGHDHIAALRLSDQGLYRYYTTCCGTPLGNTPGPSVPFIGVPAPLFGTDRIRVDRLLGSASGVVYGQYAIGDPQGLPRDVPLRMVLRATAKVIAWFVRGRSWPHPFFERAGGRSLFPVRVLTAERRESLRDSHGSER